MIKGKERKSLLSILIITAMMILFSVNALAVKGATVNYDGYNYLVVNVIINNKETELPQKALLINDVTYVPFRAICDELGSGTVSWDERTKTGTYTSANLSISATKGSNYIIANGRYLYHQSEILIIDNRLYLPIRPVAKAFCANVNWINETRSVSLNKTGNTFESGDSYYNANDLYWLSRIINAESGYEPLLGKIAVGNVVLNRTNNSQFPDSVYGVIFDSRYGVAQFQPVSSNAINNAPNDDSIIAAKICLDGYSVSDEALFFQNSKTATSAWITKSCTFLFDIGNHSFYK